MKKLIFFLFFIGTLNLKAQVADVIEIDTNTFEPSKALPFDKRFILRIPIKGADKVTFVGLVKHDRNESLDATVRRRVEKNSSYGIPVIDPSFYEIKKGDKKNYLQIDFRDSLLLDPSRKYSILYSTGTSDEVIESFNTYHAIWSNAKLSDSAKVQALKNFLKNVWNPISDAIKEKTGLILGISPVKNVDQIPNRLGVVTSHIPDELEKTYSSIKAKYVARDVIIANLQHAIDNSSIYTKFGENAILSSYFKLISHDDATFEKEYKKIRIADKEQNENIYTLIQATQASFKDLLGGYVNISCLECKPTKATLYEDRIVNLTKTIAAIKEIEQTFFSISQTDASYIDTYQDIRVFTVELQNSVKLLKDIIKENNFIIEQLNNEKNLNNTNLISGNSFIIGFDTRNKFAITPDFGLLTTVAPPEEFKQYPMLIPYLGFHVNFRYVDKDQDFRSYRKKPLHYLSAFVGWSLKSVENKDKGISNFFSSSSLITGIGFRLGNAVRLTYSRLWYYQTAPNNSTPSLKNFGLVGISLDAGIKDLLNGLNIFLK